MGSWAHRLRDTAGVKRALDFTYGTAIVVAGGLLFQIDINQPRGVLDGIGYAALVSLTSRFGKRILLLSATVTSFLTVLGSVLVPDEGISILGMWGNRAFAILSIWAVALVMRQRIDLLEAINKRSVSLQRHQVALETMVRECLLTQMSLTDKLAFICRTGTQALECSSVIIGLRDEQKGTFTIQQSWREEGKPNHFPPGTVLPEDPPHKDRMRARQTLAVEDLELDPTTPERLRRARLHDVRSSLAAEIYLGGPQTGAILFGRGEPHKWSEEEATFVRALANLIALLLSSQTNAETLAALELTGDGIFTEDRDANVQYANRTARLLAGTGKDGPDYPRPRAPLRGNHDRSEIQAGGRELEVYRTRLPGGGIITRLSDVTQRNQALAAQAKLEERLRQVAKMEAVGQLASGVAHDFNNILGAIRGFASFIAEDAAENSQNREFANRILSASERGKDMVQQIMAVGDAKPVALGVADLGRIIENCQELMAATMPPGTRLEICPGDTPLLVRGNEVQIGQLLTNLVANGRDALADGDGWVRVAAMRVPPGDIEALIGRQDSDGERLLGEPRTDCAFARLTVRDNGVGIPSEIIDRIFEPFFSTKGRRRGTGLGLAVVHGVVRSHGGFCDVRSRPGQGTEFAIYLPLLEEAGHALPSGDLKPCRVLIVDDEVDMADMLSIGLERLGFQTVSVHSPMLALAAIEEDPSAFDALLTDQIMPGMHGTELIAKVRRTAPGMRTVLCTAYMENADQSHKLAEAADAVLYKPVDIPALAKALTA